MQSNVMGFLLNVILLLYATAVTEADDVKDELNEANNLTVHDISNRLLTLFDIHYNNKKLDELNKKLERINHYVVDHHLVAEVLTNLTMETKLNETNFFEALNESDHFTYLTTNDSKNLYVKLKEKMTRDDILKIAAERGTRSKLVKSARRMMQDNRPADEDDEKISDIVDKILAQAPVDQHQVKAKESMNWDPQTELDEMKTYHGSKSSGRRIFKGERTIIKHYPFMASLHLMGKFWCGAVLLGSDLAVTSASCLQLIHNNRFFRENPRVLQVRIGSNHSRLGGELIDVMEVFFHPSYNPKTLKNNLALMRLRRHLLIRSKTFVRYLPIALQGNALPSTTKVLLLGWGVTKLSQKVSFEPIFLQRKVLPVYPNTFCREVYGNQFDATTMFCAGTLTTGEGACDHDAGGPAVLSGRLVGIISFGPSICGFADTPTVFTKVGAFADWIETINETMPANYIGKARTSTSTKSPIYEIMATYKKSVNSGLVKYTPVVVSMESEETETAPAAATPPAATPPADTPPSTPNATAQSPSYKYILRTEHYVDTEWTAAIEENEKDKKDVLASTATTPLTTSTTTPSSTDAMPASPNMPSNEEWTAVI